MTREIQIMLVLRHYQSRRTAASFQELMFTPSAISQINEAQGITRGLTKQDVLAQMVFASLIFSSFKF